MAKKVYLRCSAREKQFDNGGSVINVGIKVEDLADFARRHKNDRGYLKLVIAPRREPGQYGDTHYIYLDTFTPRTGAGAMQDRAERQGFQARHSEPLTGDDIPF